MEKVSEHTLTAVRTRPLCSGSQNIGRWLYWGGVSSLRRGVFAIKRRSYDGENPFFFFVDDDFKYKGRLGGLGPIMLRNTDLELRSYF